MSRHLALLALALRVATGIAVLGFPLAGAADPAQKVVRVAFVAPGSASTAPRGVTAFWERLRELGYVEGQNLVIEARWADGRYDRVPALMAEVIGQKIDVLVTYSTPAGIAAKKATTTIPIVDAVMADPIGTGLVKSLARPDGNLTGLSLGWSEGIGGKWLELLQETVPHLSTVAVIANPDDITHRGLVHELEAVAPLLRLKLKIVDLREAGMLDRAFKQARRQAQAVLVLPGPVAMGQRQTITSLAAKHRLPAIYALREFADAGGLMAYGPELTIMFRRAAEYVDKILRGAKPGDLPIEQPTQYALVVNLKTAKALGLTIPESILLRADEVIR
jgi:putative ABC transport system substrate-binding protein